MKKIFVLLFFVLVSFAGCAESTIELEKKVVVAYVTSWSEVMPNPIYITHINYAFGHEIGRAHV